MQIKKITDDYSVCDQISASDVALIKAMGFKSIMCNRPDGEEFGQPSAEIIKQAAKSHNIDFYHVPMGRTGISMTTMAEFRKVINEAKKPVFAYCRSGNRCTILWNASQG